MKTLTQAEIQQLADDGISYPWTPWQLLSLKRERDDALARAVNAEDEAQRMHDDACELQQQIDDLEAEVERWKEPVVAERTALAERLELERNEAHVKVAELEAEVERLRAEKERL